MRIVREAYFTTLNAKPIFAIYLWEPQVYYKYIFSA